MKQLTIRSISILLALIMVLLMIPSARAYTADPWAEAELEVMNDAGLIPDSLSDGDLTRNITRLDMCRIAVLSYESLTGRKIPLPIEHPFPDTTDPAVEKAQWVGLVKGSDDGLFHPDQELTRIDFFAFVGQFLEAIGYPVSVSDYADLSLFSDGATVPEWARAYTSLTVGIEVVRGTSSEHPTLSWNNTATAQEAICMFQRAYSAAREQELNPPEMKPVPVAYGDLSAWAEEAVHEMDSMGLVPDSVKYTSMRGPITRADMCRIVMNSYKNLWGITDEDMGPVGDSPFNDTNDIDVINAYRLEIISGDGNGTFRPNDSVTRQEFFKIAQNFLEAIGYLHEDDTMVTLDDYSDGGSFAEYAQAPTRVLIALGLVNGSVENITNEDGEIVEEKLLNPEDAIVCEEALAVFHRAHHFAMNWRPSENENPGEETTPPEDNRNEEELSTVQRVINLALAIEADDSYWYVYGGKKPSDGGFDCSGFVSYVYNTEAGTNLHPPCSGIWNALSDTTIPKDQLLPGDVVFFWNDSKTDFQHVGMYIGDGKFVHAANSRTGIIISELDEPYYLGHYMDAKRVIE